MGCGFGAGVAGLGAGVAGGGVEAGGAVVAPGVAGGGVRRRGRRGRRVDGVEPLDHFSGQVETLIEEHEARVGGAEQHRDLLLVHERLEDRTQLGVERFLHFLAELVELLLRVLLGALELLLLTLRRSPASPCAPLRSACRFRASGCRSAASSDARRAPRSSSGPAHRCAAARSCPSRIAKHAQHVDHADPHGLRKGLRRLAAGRGEGLRAAAVRLRRAPRRGRLSRGRLGGGGRLTGHESGRTKRQTEGKTDDGHLHTG